MVPALGDFVEVFVVVTVEELADVLGMVAGTFEPVREPIAVLAAELKLVVCTAWGCYERDVCVVRVLAAKECHSGWTADCDCGIVVVEGNTWFKSVRDIYSTAWGSSRTLFLYFLCYYGE